MEEKEIRIPNDSKENGSGRERESGREVRNKKKVVGVKKKEEKGRRTGTSHPVWCGPPKSLIALCGGYSL